LLTGIVDDSLISVVQNQFFLLGDNAFLNFAFESFTFTNIYITHYMKGYIRKSIIGPLVTKCDASIISVLHINTPAITNSTKQWI